MKLCYISAYRNEEIEKLINSSENFRITSNPDKADILVYQGGGDVNPSYYGEKEHDRTMVDRTHDKMDLAIWNKYPEKPKVGICRGGQFLNVMSGGEMWQDVNMHGIIGTHEIINLLPIPGTEFAQGYLIEVTSTHHQMMVPHKEYAEVLAVANRATIFSAGPGVNRPIPEYDTEVVWYEHTKSLCFQPHPEYGRMPALGKKYFFNLMEHFFGTE